MGKKQVIEYWMFPSIRPSAILCYTFLLVQMQGQSPTVHGESLYVPNLSITPEVVNYLHMGQGQGNGIDTVSGNEESIAKDGSGNNDRESRDAVMEGAEQLKKAIPDYFRTDFKNNGDHGRNSGFLKQQIGGSHGEQRQLSQLPPMGFLFPKQFYQSANPNPKIFNQLNGILMDPEASVESETNGRLGFLTGFNEFNLPSKHVVVRSRPSRFQVIGPSSTSKRNSGYMCHFKLCQLGASGKRRWTDPLE